MKRILFLFLLLLFPVLTVCAQFSSDKAATIEQYLSEPVKKPKTAKKAEHLRFMNISMNYSLPTFSRKLQEKGLTLVRQSDEVVAFKGRFAGSSGCHIGVVFVPQNQKVRRVGVLFPGHDDWDSLYRHYQQVQESLVQKYGQPAICTESFETIFEPSNDQERYRCVVEDECCFITSFEVAGGSISICLLADESAPDPRPCVFLVYIDRLNDNLASKQVIDDL